ncbi:MAG: hypothetical protein HN576_05095 [Bacteriovoracaceae bacterium]|jgi:HSP20 family molecular chaperone IbpA|nr:hypothetical protein [Bacteriovoracaceae bacterium]
MNSLLRYLLKFIFLTLILLSSPSYSQSTTEKRNETNKKFRKSLVDKLNQEKKLLEKLLGVGIYKQFDGKFEKLLEQFDDGFHDNMDKIFKNNNFNSFFQDADQFQFGFGPMGKWSETGGHRIYTLLQNFPKNTPLDLKIEKNRISIKGVIEKSFKKRGRKGEIAEVKRMSVNQEIRIPHDVYAEKASFDQFNGKTRIFFPKKNPSKIQKKSSNKQKNGLKPLKRIKGELSI